MTIFKYNFHEMGVNVLKLPKTHRILSVGLDLQDHLSLWAEVDNNTFPVEVPFFVAYTGDTVPTDFPRFLGTVTGGLIYHVYTK